MICEPCGGTIEEGQQAIYGQDRGDGILVFGWTCCHKPVGDVAVVLGSQRCVELWLRRYPQYRNALEKLIASHRKPEHYHGEKP